MDPLECALWHRDQLSMSRHFLAVKRFEYLSCVATMVNQIVAHWPSIMTIENVFTAYQPLLVFSKFLGFFPMSFVGPVRKGNLKFRWINIIPTCFIVLLYTLILFYILTNQFVDINSKILYYGWTLPYLVECLFQLLFALCHIKDAKKIKFFLRKLQIVDEMVK